MNPRSYTFHQSSQIMRNIWAVKRRPIAYQLCPVFAFCIIIRVISRRRPPVSVSWMISTFYLWPHTENEKDDLLWLIIARYSSCEGHFPCLVQYRSKLCPMNKFWISSMNISQHRWLSSCLTWSAACNKRKFAELIVCPAPNITWVAGWPRRRGDASSMSSSLYRHSQWHLTRPRLKGTACTAYINDALCKVCAMDLNWLIRWGGKVNQTFSPSINVSRIALEGRELM